MDGWTDGRTCNDIVLSRHDRKKIFMENISESSNWKNPSSTVWLTGGRTDGRTCNDIVLSRHDRQKIFMKNISESSNWKKSSDGLQASSQELVPID